MKTLFLFFLFPVFFSGKLLWLNNLDEARQLAKAKHEFILLNFSGSDWCGPCIKMHDEIFESTVFQQYADIHLILVNADFPRLKKNQLPKDQQKRNEILADKYNSKGIFPYTILLDSKGNVLKTWEGFFEPGAQNFIDQIKNELLGRTE
ncbi:MAG: thioredoxin family protein [Chitinophagales bacterium]